MLSPVMPTYLLFKSLLEEKKITYTEKKNRILSFSYLSKYGKVHAFVRFPSHPEGSILLYKKERNGDFSLLMRYSFLYSINEWNKSQMEGSFFVDEEGKVSYGLCLPLLDLKDPSKALSTYLEDFAEEVTFHYEAFHNVEKIYKKKAKEKEEGKD